MLSKALPVIALIGAAAGQASSATGHVESDEREIQLDGDSWDITGEGRDNWKREVIEDGKYTTDQELTEQIWGSGGDGSEPAGDGKSRPLCNISGFENQVDPQGPSDQCCRIYEYSLYGGRFRDFCIQEEVTADTFLNWDLHKDKMTRTIQLDDYGWHNEMNSWKCGSMVWFEACQYPEDAKARMNEVELQGGNAESDVRKTHCDSGILQNRAMIGKSDEADQITIGIIYNNACQATIFNESECSGSSKLIRSDIIYRPDITEKGSVPTQDQLWQGSWLHYDEDKWPMLKSGTVESILYNGGCAIEIFNEGKFQSESYTMRMPPSENYHCAEYLYLNALNDYEWADAFDAEDYTGYKAINIREIYFPENWKREKSGGL